MKLPYPVSLDEDLINWINNNFKELKFRNKSHLVEYVLTKYRQSVDYDKTINDSEHLLSVLR